ncbi:MAG: DUF2000 family protein [Holophagales bacterium]|jgi:hypothetical protein|nr:DUF2000 family protein [Holophagales bacterium]
MSEELKRLAVVLHPSLDAGQAANAAAIVAGGLRCEAFAEPIQDAAGVPHAAISCNVVVLKAKSAGQLVRLVDPARELSIGWVVFTRKGTSLSNSFHEYQLLVKNSRAEDLETIAVGIFGTDEAVRALTRAFSVYR